MAGRGKEIVVAADARRARRCGSIHAMTFQSEAPEQGNGPYSTPLIVGDRLFTTGVAGRMQSIDKKSGKLLWTAALWQEHKGTRMMYGYASSPIRLSPTRDCPRGRRGKAVMAFRQTDGSVVWAKNDFDNTYSSPLLIT